MGVDGSFVCVPRPSQTQGVPPVRSSADLELHTSCLIFASALVMLFNVFVADLYEAGGAELSGLGLTY